ncbi:hypothetical protein PHLGIDRAFT_270672 [Phlebiopsis gigantea 11061_1 CR5-6]|uniref:Protein kinase domain-containing protein n=1 Tax=Phlebiopsis gigantea (strain 11061_1 CR5-6) TaxID=745531 RepID=A0A0C3NEA2_PHLG1|nr:hypothetical protein PHLGIDRAFT_270672 [Phlebiopsis gigantea 11061_1 CR5-6]
MDRISGGEPAIKVGLDAVKKQQAKFNYLQARLRTAIPPRTHCPPENDEGLIRSLLHMALDELKAQRPPRYRQIILELRGADLETVYTELLSTFSRSGTPEERDISRRYLTTLVQATDRFPEQFLQQTVNDISAMRVDGGGFSDIFTGRLMVNGKNKFIALKRVTMFPRTSQSETHIQRMYLEILSCMSLKHTNIIEVFGLYKDATSSYILTPYLQHGNIRAYVPKIKEKHAYYGVVDIIEWVHALIVDIAKGVKYLHDEYIAHGDLRGVNILIDGNARAVITDFGLAVYVNAYSSEFSSMRDGNYKWIAPEGLGADGATRASVRPTPHMDVWSFAHVCAEVSLCPAPTNAKC